MNPKYLILYIIAATLALGLAIYVALTTNLTLSYGRVALNVIISFFFYYLAFKAYHEKKDQELM